MAQKKENRACSADSIQLIPKASTDISSGDVVVMARKNDPISLSALGPAGRVSPIAAARQGQWCVGVADNVFTSAVVGATDYATPDADNKINVLREGQFYLALSTAAGKAGDAVVYASGASGAQLFAIDNMRQGYAVARVVSDFSGASSGDLQLCELILKPTGGPDVAHWLENRVVNGCEVLLHAAPGSQVKVGHNTGTVVHKNLVLIQNAIKSIAQDVTLAFGGVGSAAASTIRFKWVVARSGSFAIRSGSGSKAALASYTVAGVTAGLLAPVTMTAGEIPIALLIQFSAATQSAARIKNIRGLGVVPRVGSWGI
ncbi:MAG: hypothetical protein KGZ65_04220 [Sphingomonadales bacterium]|nr:hypothetical protein [Sphingomonadaceae bacterium]MBS3930419.1 hypothetical protein [Sphingomonadales bacterium]